jgi:uncharacterized protein
VVAYFVDSSALVKRYVEEVGTSWVRGITRRETDAYVYIASVTPVEVTSAIARRRRGKSLSPVRASAILSRFRTHLAGRYTILEITPALIDDAMNLANIHELRAYDAVQLAVSAGLHKDWVDAGFAPVVFVSSDQDLNVAATAEGLSVIDPRLHPSG